MSYVMERSKKHRMQSNPGQARNSNNRKYRWIDWTTRRKPFDNFRHPGNTTEFLQSNYLLSHCENDEWSWYQIVDGREATWSCSLSVTLPSLAQVSSRNMSSKSWSASRSTSSLWLGLVSIPLRRLAQAGTCSPDSSQWNGKLLGALAYICFCASSQDLQ